MESAFWTMCVPHRLDANLQTAFPIVSPEINWFPPNAGSASKVWLWCIVRFVEKILSMWARRDFVILFGDEKGQEWEFSISGTFWACGDLLASSQLEDGSERQ